MVRKGFIYSFNPHPHPHPAPPRTPAAAGLQDRSGREDQGQHQGQSRAPVSGHQAVVWLRQSALPGDEEEHCAAQNAVHVEQFMDGAKEVDGAGGSGAPANGE